jgi:hypothetical protein
MKAFQLLLPPLKNALSLPQFGMCIVIDICDTGGREGGREGVFSKILGYALTWPRPNKRVGKSDDFLPNYSNNCAHALVPHRLARCWETASH